jgi:hypothetical protein
VTGLTWGALGLVGMFLFASLGDLVSEEVRGWLDLAPRAMLRLAAAQLAQEVRDTIYKDEWLPELAYVLRGAESRPITRVIRGTTFAVGLLIAARRINRYRSAALKQVVRTGPFALRYLWIYYRRIYRHLRELYERGRAMNLELVVAAFSDDLKVTPETLLSDPRFVDLLEVACGGHFCTRPKPGTPQDLDAFKWIPAYEEQCDCTQT